MVLVDPDKSIVFASIVKDVIPVEASKIANINNFLIFLPGVRNKI